MANNSISFQHISTESGLPQSTINDIFQDSQGYMWFGTYDGLSRYDGYQFINFKNDPIDQTSISNNIVVSIMEDSQGYLWVGTAQNGVNRFDPKTGLFKRFVSQSDDFDSLSHAQVYIIHEDENKRIWVGTDNGLNLYLPEKQAFAHFYNNPLDKQSLPPGAIVDIVDDGFGNLWIASNEMLAHFNIEQQVYHYFEKSDMPTQINALYLDDDNSLWIGTRFEGLFHLKSESIKPQSQEFNNVQFEQYKHEKDNPNSLSFNDVRSILRTKLGDLWIATEEGGLNVRRKGDVKFQAFKRNSADPHSLSINDVWSLYQDKSGLLWVGTAGGGLNTTQPFNSLFSRLTHSPYENNGLSHEYVWDIKEDRMGNIWFGTLNGIDQYNPESEHFSHISKFESLSNQPIGNRIQAFAFDNQGDIWFGNQDGQLAIYSSKTKKSKLINRKGFPEGYISYNRIRMINKDRFGRIWIGTDDGLLKMDSNSHEIISEYYFSQEGQLGDSTIRTMLPDQQGNIWFGTWDRGLQKYDLEFDKIVSYKNEPMDPHSLSNNTVRSLYFDNEGNLWVGTFNGLNKFSAVDIANNKNHFTRYLEKDGLPSSAVYGIASHIEGKLWLSTNNGLSHFDTVNNIFKNYSVEDGLSANEFSGNAVLKSTDGNIYFGGVNGVTIVSNKQSKLENFQPNIVISSLSVLRKKYKPDGVYLEKNEYQFSYDKNDIAFEFASLDYRHVKRNKFRYRLLPYNNQWTETSYPNQAVFTNLDPNDYRFELQATNGNGQWFDQTVVMKINILPPLWLTWWAYIIYSLAVMILILFFIYRHKKSLEEQKLINQHLRRVDQLKDEFLANTSHELRTPLNGIIGIAESLKEGSAGQQNLKTLNHLGLIVDGGKRLAQLVNDILDFKKLTHHTLILQRKAVDLKSIVNVVISLLRPLAENKSLTLINDLSNDLPLLFADEDRVQQIFHNLIGNAIKYTIKGQITISASLNVNELVICVRDTGIGIEQSKIDEIFAPFEQLDLSENLSEGLVQKGTGLGLSVTKQLIEQHDGQIWVETTLGNGSQFYFSIPCWIENKHSEDESFIDKNRITFVEENQLLTTNLTADNEKNNQLLCKGKILIADDDPINLQVLNDLLDMNQYQVVCVNDGDEALRVGLSEKFDLAILDIMMPGLSGYQVTKKLREKYNAIELPILLLSARNQPGDVTAGFKAGANDYVTKPIEREVLLSRIKTMRLLGGLAESKRQKQHANTLKQACERLGKYFPKQMVNQIITTSDDNLLMAERKQATILFADLAGFTAVSDRFEPEAITDLLNNFLGKMGSLVEKYDGILNEILGDGLVVLFGTLDNMPKNEQARKSAALAIEMQQTMVKIANEWLEAGFDHNVKLRIGLHQDFVTVGNFGSKDIMAYRAVGSGVNFAARLESFSSPGEITVSYPIYAQCKELFNFSELEEIQFKGFNHKHRVCRLLS